MGINWIKVEEKMPVDNGKIQKFLVCTTMKTSVFQNCDIRTCYFTDRFKKEDSHIPDGIKITYWAELEKPEELKQVNDIRDLFVNTENENDVVTLEEIKRRYIDIQGTVEGFEKYVANGFRDGIEAEYRRL